MRLVQQALLSWDPSSLPNFGTDGEFGQGSAGAAPTSASETYVTKPTSWHKTRNVIRYVPVGRGAATSHLGGTRGVQWVSSARGVFATPRSHQVASVMLNSRGHDRRRVALGQQGSLRAAHDIGAESRDSPGTVVVAARHGREVHTAVSIHVGLPARLGGAEVRPAGASDPRPVEFLNPRLSNSKGERDGAGRTEHCID